MSWTTTVVLAYQPHEPPETLRAHLQREGRRLIVWHVSEAAPAGVRDCDLLVLSGSAAEDPQIGEALRAACGPRSVLFALTSASAPWADAALNPDTSPRLVADRVGALLRLSRLEWEYRLRRHTITGLSGAQGEDKALKAPPEALALHIGGPSAGFSSLGATLKERGIDLRPVLSAGLALDQIESGLIDAVLLDAAAAPQTLRELSIIMRRNSDLALCPVLVLDRAGNSTAQARAPSLVADVVRGTLDHDLIVTRLEQLVREHRRRRRAVHAIGRTRAKGVFDSRATLFSTRFLDAHLETHMAEAQRTGRSLTFGLLRITPDNEVLPASELEQLAQHSANLVARLIRLEDVAAPVAGASIGLLFPATLEMEANTALQRIAAVVRATRFHSARNPEGTAVEVEKAALGIEGTMTGTEIYQEAIARLGQAAAAV